MAANVVVHIYDVGANEVVTRVNEALRPLGTGAFHAAVEVYGEEWSYGGTEDDVTGVFSCVPKQCEMHTYRESLPMGRCPLSENDCAELLERMSQEWRGLDYDLLRKNCCHFSAEFVDRLGVGPMPPWVTQLAGAGATLQKAAGQVSAAAIIAAAKAGEIDEEYKVKEKAIAAAQLIAEKAKQANEDYKIAEKTKAATKQTGAKLRQLDEEHKIQETAKDLTAKGVDMSLTAAVTAMTKLRELDQEHKITEQTNKGIQDLVAQGKQERGSSSDSNYKFGDFSRGLFSKLTKKP